LIGLHKELEEHHGLRVVPAGVQILPGGQQTSRSWMASKAAAGRSMAAAKITRW
jgi:hypothetical protein